MSAVRTDDRFDGTVPLPPELIVTGKYGRTMRLASYGAGRVFVEVNDGGGTGYMSFDEDDLHAIVRWAQDAESRIRMHKSHARAEARKAEAAANPATVGLCSDGTGTWSVFLAGKEYPFITLATAKYEAANHNEGRGSITRFGAMR